MKVKSLSLVCIAIVIALAGCALPTNQVATEDKTVDVSGGAAKSFDVEVGGIPDASVKAIGNSGISKVYVKVLSSARGVLVPTTGGSLTETNAKEFTWDAATSRWKGTIDVTGATASVTLIAYAVDASGNHIYAGYAGSTNAGGHVQILASACATAGYTVGGTAANNFGPAGGYIFYKDTTNKRFYELAPTDASTSNIYGANSGTRARGTPIQTGPANDYILGGTAGTAAAVCRALTTGGYSYVAPAATDTFTLSVAGSNGSTTLTVTAINGAKIKVGDILTGSTSIAAPCTVTANTGTQLTIYQALTGTIATTVTLTALHTSNLRWFLPSTLEFAQVYTNVRTIAGLTNAMYWTSTEASTPNGYQYNPTTGTAAASVVKSTLLRVRAVRSFPYL